MIGWLEIKKAETMKKGQNSEKKPENKRI